MSDNVSEQGMEQVSVQEPQQNEDLQSAVQDAIEDGATPAEVKKMIKEYEIKVNGKKKKVSIDLSDEKEIIRRLQLSEASHGAMQESAELKKLFNQEIMKAKQNPWNFIQELGLDPDQILEQRLLEKVEEAKKSPEQIEREKLQRELQAAREELKKREEETQQAQMIQLQTQAHAQLEKEIQDALIANPHLPRVAKTVRRIADAMTWAINEGYADVTVKDVLPSVEAEIRAEFNEFMSALPEDVMESYMGKRNLDRLRKKRIAQAKVVPSVETVKPVATKPVEQEKRAKTINSRDFFKNIKK